MAAVRFQKLFAVVTRNIAALKDTGDHTIECYFILPWPLYFQGRASEVAFCTSGQFIEDNAM